MGRFASYGPRRATSFDKSHPPLGWAPLIRDPVSCSRCKGRGRRSLPGPDRVNPVSRNEQTMLGASQTPFWTDRIPKRIAECEPRASVSVRIGVLQAAAELWMRRILATSHPADPPLWPGRRRNKAGRARLADDNFNGTPSRAIWVRALIPGFADEVRGRYSIGIHGVILLQVLTHRVGSVAAQPKIALLGTKPTRKPTNIDPMMPTAA